MDELEGLPLTTAMHWGLPEQEESRALFTPSTPRLQATPDSIFI